MKRLTLTEDFRKKSIKSPRYLDKEIYSFTKKGLYGLLKLSSQKIRNAMVTGKVKNISIMAI